MRVLAVDPGREKCGLAVCGPEGVLARRVARLGDLPEIARGWVEGYQVERILIGDQTWSKQVFEIVQELGVPVQKVSERGTTLLARRRYFQDHPRSGWRRFLPVSLQLPPEPYDDYAAVVLAETYLEVLRKP